MGLACFGVPLTMAAQHVAVEKRPETSIPAVGADGRVRFGHASAALAIGTHLVIADPTSSTLALFDRDGTFIRTIGRAGDGPGEFRFIRQMMRCDDTQFVVWDTENSRLTYFSASGALLRSEGTSSQQPLHEVICGERGSIGLVERRATDLIMERGQVEVLRATGRILLAENGSSRRILRDSVRLGEWVRLGGNAVPRPQGGQAFMVMVRRSMILLHADQPVIEAMTFDGTTTGRRVLGLGPSQGSYADAVDRIVMDIPQAVQARVRDLLLSVPAPDARALTGGLFADPAGLLWVVLPGSSREGSRLLILDGTTLRDVGEARIPAGHTVLSVSGDMLVTRSLSENEGDIVINLFRIRRSGS